MVVAVALRRHNSGRGDEWCSEVVPSAYNAEANMHPEPLPQRHPPPTSLPAEMSRHSAAHEVVH
eukprot:1153231-Pleurochrysis_carterae.AAC.1